MKPYTKTGDFGETCIINGKIKKSDARILCLANIDELSAVISKSRMGLEDPEVTQILLRIEQKLSKISSIIAGTRNQINEEDIKKIEELIDKYYIKKEGFLRPKTEESAVLNFARAVCRRTEVHINKIETTETVRKYINRLSDLLFALAVHYNRNAKYSN